MDEGFLRARKKFGQLKVEVRTNGIAYSYPQDWPVIYKFFAFSRAYMYLRSKGYGDNLLRSIAESRCRTSLQRPPGARLRIVSEFFFSRRTYKEVFEPTIRDLFDEYCEALTDNRPWKARWVQIRGYWSFWSAVFAQMPISAVKVVYKIWKATH